MSTIPILANKSGQDSQVSYAWTLGEAVKMLALNPHDQYLQYVVLQLEHESNMQAQASQRNKNGRAQNDRAMQANASMQRNNGRAQPPRPGRTPTLLGLISGAAAVQECLQLDAMDSSNAQSDFAPASKTRVAELNTVTVRSHPWKEMFGDKSPLVSRLSKMVPDDYLFAECRSFDSVFEAIKAITKLAETLSVQVNHKASTNVLLKRLETQLGLDSMNKSLLARLTTEVAFCSSDLFVGDGSDITLLFCADDSESLHQFLCENVAEIKRQNAGVLVQKSSYNDIEYNHIFSEDKSICLYYAEPSSGLHIRSNSLPALKHILDATCKFGAASMLDVDGQFDSTNKFDATGNSDTANRPDGASHSTENLGIGAEFTYVRSLLPWRHENEDVLIYLSDPFIRRIVGPQLRLSAQRKFLCKNNLQILDHAIMLFCTNNGRLPDSVETLVASNTAPPFNQEIHCPHGGVYELFNDDNKLKGSCSAHGRADQLKPCLETPVDSITFAESKNYEQFLEQYNQYWTTYFDPIAIRLKHSSETTRIETVILPLIDNSIYTQLSTILGGTEQALDLLPVPKRNILSTAFRFNKEAITGQYLNDQTLNLGLMMAFPNRAAEAQTLDLKDFVLNVMGEQIGLHVCDSAPMISLDMSALLGTLAGMMNNQARRQQAASAATQGAAAQANQRGFNPLAMGQTWLWISFLIASLNAPVYLSMPINNERGQDADKFLETLYLLLSAGGQQQNQRIGLLSQSYKFELDDHSLAYCSTLEFGPAKLRIYWAKIGDAIFVASKSFILNDLAQATKGSEADNTRYNDKPAEGHAMLRLRPQNWKQVQSDVATNQAEINRSTCLNNLTAAEAVRRAQQALAENGLQCSFDLDGSIRYCPDGGNYIVADNHVECQLHGSALQLKQPSSQSDVDFMHGTSAITAQLSFLHDGLRSVLTIDKSKDCCTG